MGKFLLFKVQGTKGTPQKQTANLKMIPDRGGRNWIDCLVEEETSITKELLNEAFDLVEDLEIKKPDIIITSPEMAEKLDLFPPKFSSVMFFHSVFNAPAPSEKAEQSRQDCIKYLTQLPDFITKVHFNVSHKWKNPEEVIKAIPKQVTHFTINADVIENCTHKELISFFSSFPNHVKEISLLGSDAKNLVIDDAVLRDLIIRLPMSVKTLKVPKEMNCSNHITERTINLDAYRNKEYFPNSYKEFTSEDLFESAKDLLNDYTKNTNCFPLAARFFTLHMFRHHVDKVNEIVQNSTGIDDLLKKLEKIESQEDFNHTGSLARRIHYIKHLQYQSQKESHEVEPLNNVTMSM
ncbi:DUF5617 domain-containing protein [Legionella sp. PATHC038]|uniref:DUF5617 domain-containing protein n=1 Tax=Legionella sheltonii TaxID=2992041 RepID=UPI002242D905|nr:DUF5617 domain-containing protein [Legionella sp. PATHC038]MCW8400823.1 DUF5617 domain-containing protein [Legionella sp. PATHC038]